MDSDPGQPAGAGLQSDWVTVWVTVTAKFIIIRHPVTSSSGPRFQGTVSIQSVTPRAEIRARGDIIIMIIGNWAW